MGELKGRLVIRQLSDVRPILHTRTENQPPTGPGGQTVSSQLPTLLPSFPGGPLGNVGHVRLFGGNKLRSERFSPRVKTQNCKHWQLNAHPCQGNFRERIYEAEQRMEAKARRFGNCR